MLQPLHRRVLPLIHPEFTQNKPDCRESLAAVALLPSASATSPGESFGFQPGAAETCAQAQRFRCVSMYGDHGADFAMQNRFFAVFATGIACNSSKNWKAVAPMHEVQVRPARLNPLDSKAALPETPLRGGSGALRGSQWRGSLLPVHQLVKKTFLTS